MSHVMPDIIFMFSLMPLQGEGGLKYITNFNPLTPGVH